MLDFNALALHKDGMDESTPPPVPPPPLTAQQPPRSWWARNWKWFVPTGCLTFFALIALVIACVTMFVFGVLKSTDVYKTALSRAKNDQRVVAALGTPIKEGLVPMGKTNVEGSSGQSDLAIPISGPKGKATIYAVATKSEGQWNFSKLSVAIEGGQTIDLDKTATEPEPTSEDEEEMDQDETTDSRIDSIKLERETGGRLQPVKNFKREDSPQHIVVALTEGSEDTRIRTVWTNLNAGGATNQQLWAKELVTSEGNLSADFSLSNAGSKTFPPGDYKIDIYLDDELVQTVRYKVQ
ncbi:MAG TPA: cytochrome c oxidase assembly factor Coa1 family protein [Chthoniobacterales bacterium]